MGKIAKKNLATGNKIFFRATHQDMCFHISRSIPTTSENITIIKKSSSRNSFLKNVLEWKFLPDMKKWRVFVGNKFHNRLLI